MLTVREVADLLQVAASSVRIWASKGRFRGAERHETPVSSYWLIPESAIEQFERRTVGRPRKSPRTPPRSRTKQSG
ncbi:MAG: helix-turn-helix domain-containing protein [Blastocatellia bacterium]